MFRDNSYPFLRTWDTNLGPTLTRGLELTRSSNYCTRPGLIVPLAAAVQPSSLRVDPCFLLADIIVIIIIIELSFLFLAEK